MGDGGGRGRSSAHGVASRRAVVIDMEKAKAALEIDDFPGSRFDGER